MNDGYVITTIDPQTNLVYATFTYQGNTLNTRFPVLDVTNAAGITTTCQDQYNQFISDVSSLPQQQLVPDVQALVAIPVDAGTFNTSVATIEGEQSPPVPTPPITSGQTLQ